jgi:hypothetical protein
MDRVRADLLGAARLMRVDGRHVRVGGAEAGDVADPALADRVGEALYARWFTRTTVPATPAGTDRALVARLRAAHAASDRFERGWVALLDASGALCAARGRERLPLAPLDHVNVSRLAAPVRPGDALAVSARRDLVDEAAGWWQTAGTAGAATAPPLVRLYWNGAPAVAAELTRGVTGALERARVPYTMKCPLNPSLFARDDPIVVYLERAAWRQAGPALREVHRALAPFLRPRVPPLTLRLGRGVAFAEDPADGRSFGQSRSAAVAAGLVALLPAPAADRQVLAALRASLLAHGISAVRPYLGTDSPADETASW